MAGANLLPGLFGYTLAWALSVNEGGWVYKFFLLKNSWGWTEAE